MILSPSRRRAPGRSLSIWLLLILVSAALLLTYHSQPTASAPFATITVNGTADNANVDMLANNGTCDLREAIEAVNTGAAVGECPGGMEGLDTIQFNLGTGTPTINVVAPLPGINSPVMILGDTGGATRVELNGAGAGVSDGLSIAAGGSTIRALVINRFNGHGISMGEVGGNTVINCIIGLNAAGTAALPNTGDGIRIEAAGNIIGGTTAGTRNIISGNGGNGVSILAGNNELIQRLQFAQAFRDGAISILAGNNNTIQGNYIGTDITGTVDLGNNSDGVQLENVSGNTIGGTSAAARNLISGNNGNGVLFLAGANSNQVQGNYIGTQANGASALGNGVCGVQFLSGSPQTNTIGGAAAGAGNTIAFNTSHGIQVASGTGNTLSSNAIFSNGGLGIELNNDGVTPNDPGDEDSGPNNLQNFPVLTSATIGSGAVTIQGTLNTAPNTFLRVEFFSNPACDGSGNGEGQVFLGSTNVLTDGSGSATFSVTLAVSVTPGHFLTATASGIEILQTSEFSPCLCTYGVTPTVRSFAAAGGNGSVAITTNASCAWTAMSNAPWLTLTSPTAGNGNSTVTYTVAANLNTSPRNGTLSIAGRTVVVTQVASGAVVTEDFSNGIPSTWVITDGGTATVYLNTGTPVTWTTLNPCNQVIPSPFSGAFAIVDAGCTTPGVVLDEYLFPPPFDATGLGAVYIEFFNQFHWSPDAPNTGDVDVSIDGGQTWVNVLRLENGNDGVPTPNVKSIDITSVIAANPSNVLVRLHYYGTSGSSLRQSLVLSPEQTKRYWAIDFSIYSYALNRTSQSFTASGGAGTVSVATSINVPNPQGQWTATSNATWIHVTSNTPVTGNGMVSYTVDAHSSNTPRSGTMTIAGKPFTVVQGAQFGDVPLNHPYYTEIGKLSARGVTLGCSPNSFCPDASTTREQMSAFILRALGEFNPPLPPSQRYNDVPPANIFYNFIDRLAVLQITQGCSGSPPLYCPTNPVTREQAAAFIIRALHPPGYMPAAPTMQRFQDVPPSNPFYAHIEELAARGITLGCAATPPRYCPSSLVTRGEMAVFLVRAFNL